MISYNDSFRLFVGGVTCYSLKPSQKIKKKKKSLEASLKDYLYFFQWESLMETSSEISKTAASKMAGFDIGCHRLCHWCPKLDSEVKNSSCKKKVCQNLLLLNWRDARLFAKIFTSQLAIDVL